MAEPNTTALIAALRNRRWESRREAARHLGHPSHKRATQALLKALGDEVSLVRHAAAEALAGIRLNSAPPALIAALKDKSAAVRLAAAKAIRPTGDVKALATLTELIKDEDLEVRRMAAEALGNVKHPRAARVLATALTSPGNSRPARTEAAPASRAAEVLPPETVRQLTESIVDLTKVVGELRTQLQSTQQEVAKQGRRLKKLGKKIR
jgi:HEAT repeat protein